jgi:hypothetical protein
VGAIHRGILWDHFGIIAAIVLAAILFASGLIKGYVVNQAHKRLIAYIIMHTVIAAHTVIKQKTRTAKGGKQATAEQIHQHGGNHELPALEHEPGRKSPASPHCRGDRCHRGSSNRVPDTA